jgi:hypothetical protein
MPQDQAWIRLRDARPLIEWVIRAAIAECGLTIHMLPPELLSKRVALTHYLAEQLHHLGQRKAKELEERWEAAWNSEWAAKCTELPENLHN